MEAVILEALDAWWHVCPVRRSESLLRLAIRMQRQMIFDEADIVFCLLWMCVVYEALGDISRVKC